LQVVKQGNWRVIAALVSVVAVTPAVQAQGQWPQWGGSNRDFTVETTGLADKWPEDGPKALWHRGLGSGFSSIVVDDGRLFTMYRKDKKDAHEYTIALDATTGKTIWQQQTLAAVPPETLDYGKDFSGPNSTPLVVGDRLFTVGRNAILHCYKKTDGTVLWKRDLRKEFGAETQVCGYSPSPLAFGDTIILPMGRAEGDKREGNSLVAFDQASGDVVWRRHTFRIEHSSPILITFGGKHHLVQGTRRALIGVDPASGDLLWEYAYSDPEQFEGIFATPVWDGKDVIMFSSRNVAVAVKLTTGEEGTTAQLLWSNHKTPLGMATPVLIDDMLVGPKRAKGSPVTRLLGLDIRSGKLLWAERVFPMPVAVGGAQRLVILDHDGILGLATATRKGLEIHSRHQLTETESLTPPTLVGNTLYVRDEKHIMALDLGAAGAVGGQ
jgi:outer membrane protein assembly factor BamB